MTDVSKQALACAQDVIGCKDVQHVALVIEQYLRIARQQSDRKPT